MFRLQREPAAPGVIRVPGGPAVARILAAMGFVVSLLAILLACVPSDAEPNKPLAAAKIIGASSVLVAIGVVLYWARRPRRGHARPARG